MSDRPTVIRAGFIPLTDAAPLIAAKVKGFAEREGIDLELTRETSWATIRDRLSVGQLDAAHALAPLPIACNLGLGPLKQALTVPIALGFGGNTVVVAQRHWEHLSAAGCPGDLMPAAAIAALSTYVRTRAARGEPRLKFGVVHPHSAHRYKLAYWLASGGVLPGRDVEFVVLPPPLMASALGAGRIDGFCVGEPWGSVATRSGSGTVITTTAHIWRSSPEKVLAVRQDLAERHEAGILALVRAVKAASVWCDDIANRTELVQMLSLSAYVDQPESVLASAMNGAIEGPAGTLVQPPGFLTFDASAATFPWVSHALWFATQMARWGEILLDAETIETVRATYRPTLYRKALQGLGSDLPAANAKVEGSLTEPRPIGSSYGGLTLEPDGFFDHRVFDPDELTAYVAALRASDSTSGTMDA